VLWHVFDNPLVSLLLLNFPVAASGEKAKQMQPFILLRLFSREFFFLVQDKQKKVIFFCIFFLVHQNARLLKENIITQRKKTTHRARNMR